MKKYLCVFCWILLFSAVANDELTLSPSGDNTGQNKFERIGSIEKDLINIVQAFNNMKRQQDELKNQLTLLQAQNKSLQTEKDKGQDTTAKLLTEITTLKKELAEQKKSLEQVRTSLYGDEGKKEKDSLLNEKK